MANVSLDSQTFFNPQLATGRKSTHSPRNGAHATASPGSQKQPEQDAQAHRRAATGSSPAEVVLIPSESESDYSDHDDSDDGQSNTSFPPGDEILPTPSAGGNHAKHSPVAETAGSDGQKSELPTYAAETLGPAAEGIRDGSEEPSLGKIVEPGQAAVSTEILTNPGAGDAVASSPSPSWSKLSSPVPPPTDPSLTNGVENSSGTGFAPQRNDPACGTRFPDAPGSSPNEDVLDHREPELRRTPEISQEDTRGPEHPPAPPATTLPQQLSGSWRAVQQDEPALQGSASGETRQTPRPRDITWGKTAVEMSSAIPSSADPSHLYGPNLPAVPSPRLENDTKRESMPRSVSVSNGDRDDENIPPRIPPKASRGKAAVGCRHHRSVENVNNNLDYMQDVRSDNDRGVRLPPPKRRRVRFQRYISPRQDASDDEASTSSQNSDREWDSRPLQRKRRKSSPPKRARTKATGQEMSSDSRSTRSRQGRINSPSPTQAPDEQQESVKALSVKFTEWLFKAAVVRSAIVDGVTTFQLQFKADHYCSNHTHHVLGSSQLDDGFNLRAKQSDDDVQSASSTDETEYKVEKIRKIRKRGRGHQAFVQWVGSKKSTWEPLKNFLKTEALADYEAQHGNVALGLGP